MFYLVDEKDGFEDEHGLLINAKNLKSLEVMTANSLYEVIFTHHDTNNIFKFDPHEIFNVGQVIDEIASLAEVEYNNPFIAVTDLQNIDTVQSSFGNDQALIDKVNRILIHMNEIGLIYQSEEQFILTTQSKNFCIKESPREVFEMIQAKIKPQEIEAAKWKHSL